MCPAKYTPANTQTTTNSSTQLALSKKSSRIEVHLKEEKITSLYGQSIDLRLLDFEICANKHWLTNDERSHLMVTCLKGGA